MTGERHAAPAYMPQLDALRFIAVMGVLVVHNWRPRRLPWLLRDVDWGGLGVRLFFVLSGFLITGILLECRALAEQGRQPALYYVRQFYVRRFLRIFPLYYLVIAVAVLVNMEPAREVFAWLVTYTANVYITVHDRWPGRLGHFWTLAVEEQFYFLWPWVVLFAPRRWVVGIIASGVVVAPLYRAFAYDHFPFDIGAMDFKAGTLTPGSLDSLGIGSLLAVAWAWGPRVERVQRYLDRLVLPLGVALYGAALVLYSTRMAPKAYFTAGDLGAALIFAWLVGSAARGFRGVPGALLEARPLVYLGKITYGIYVYHNLTPLMLAWAFQWAGVPYRVPGLENFVWSTLLTIALASASWHLFELPINNLKRRFEYAPRAGGQVKVALPATGGVRRLAG